MQMAQICADIELLQNISSRLRYLRLDPPIN